MSDTDTGTAPREALEVGEPVRLPRMYSGELRQEVAPTHRIVAADLRRVLEATVRAIGDEPSDEEGRVPYADPRGAYLAGLAGLALAVDLEALQGLEPLSVWCRGRGDVISWGEQVEDLLELEGYRLPECAARGRDLVLASSRHRRAVIRAREEAGASFR